MGHPIASEEIEKIEREINTREDLRGCSAGEERKREREKERERERERKRARGIRLRQPARIETQTQSGRSLAC